MRSDDLVSANVRVYMALRRETHEDVAAALGLTRPAISARLNGRTAWSLDDVDQLAEHFGVAPSSLLTQPPDVLEQLRAPGGLLDPLGRRRRTNLSEPRAGKARRRAAAADKGGATAPHDARSA